MSTLPTGTVTFLFTDVEGSTRLWEADATGMARAIEAHEVAAREIIAEFGGHLLLERGEGDSLFAVFASPSAAVQAALALQLRFLEPVAGVTLRIRMGLHAGEAQARGTTYFGRSVNRAARIRSVAKGGQIVLSSTVREIAENRLPPEIVLRDCGRHRLRDLLCPEQLFEVIHPLLPRVTGPLVTLEMHPHNLPVQLTNFIGRQEPVRDVAGMVRDHRIVTTIFGAGGCGKTRLSMQIGAEVLELFEDGVWFVEAAPIRDEAALMDEIARVLQVNLREGPITRNALLILDNCEHVREEAARCVRRLVEQVSGLHVLATSREALGLKGERIYPLRSMELPPRDTAPEALNDFEASALFLERAHEKDPNLDLTQAEASAICEIVRLLDGIPLAIEQAASHIGFLSPRLILERLDEWMAQPMEFVDDPDPRHRTLEAAIDWSFHLLSPSEQTLFFRLSVFAGGWDLKAAEAICVDTTLSRVDVLRNMQRLVGKSLVISDSDSKSGHRFRLLEPIRQYAMRHLPLVFNDLQERHYAYFSQLSESVDSRIGGPDQAEALGAAEADVDNYRLALDYALKNEPAQALAFAMNLRRFWLLTDHLSEGQRLLQAALESYSAQDELTVRALNAIGGLAFKQANYAAAERALRRAEQLLDSDEPTVTHTNILHNLGLALVYLDRQQEAEPILEQSMRQFEALDLAVEAAQAMLSLSNLLLDLDRGADALGHLRRAIPILDAHHVDDLLVLALTMAAESSGPIESSDHLRLALKKMGTAPSLSEASSTIFQVGYALLRQGEYSRAALLLAAAESLCAKGEAEFPQRHRRVLDSSFQTLKRELGTECERQVSRGSRTSLSAALVLARQSLDLLDNRPTSS